MAPVRGCDQDYGVGKTVTLRSVARGSRYTRAWRAAKSRICVQLVGAALDNYPDPMPGPEPVAPGMHDLGGVEPLASAAIDRREHALTQFDKNVDALMYLLAHPSRRIIRVDELRRAIESLAPADYARLGYYEKWLQAMRDLLVEKGVLGADEIARRMDELRGRDQDEAP
jgi:hypothetical protein